MAQSIGTVSQIIGPVVDVTFSGEDNALPKIYDSLIISKEDGNQLVLEVQSHVGENTVRTVSMDSTDGLSQGLKPKRLEVPSRCPLARRFTEDYST